MPIILYPVDLPATSEVQCADQLLVQPRVPTVEGRQVPARTQAIEVAQGQEATIRWIMRNRNGDPVDLSQCNLSSSSSSVSSLSSSGSPGSAKLRIREALSFAEHQESIEIEADVRDAPAGIVDAVLTSAAVCRAGIFRIEWAVLDSDDKILFTNQGYLLVERGQFGSRMSPNGPLSIPEIRLHLRDNDDETDNFLIDTSEWSIAELIVCMERPVQYFNESSPPINRRFNTGNFPYRYNWLNGTVAGLYEMAAHHYRRNSKNIQASSGVALDDKNKAAEYEQKAQSLWNDYKRWAQTQKAALNADAAYGGTSES